MEKSIFLSLGLSFCFAISYFEATNASENQTLKTVFTVEFDKSPIKANEQRNFLQGIDILGVNAKKNQLEVYLTEQEFLQLKSKGLHVVKNVNRMTELSALADLKDYLNPDKLAVALTQINTQFPNLTRIFELGKTHNNQSINAMEISAHVGNTNYPVIVFNGMHHAREVMTTEVVMHIAQVLTSQYGIDPEVTSWLDSFRVIVMPQVNPDGNSFVHSGKNMWRKNAYPVAGVAVGVDINRNYPTHWNYCNGSSSSPNSEVYRGPKPASEPETKAVMDITTNFKPLAYISYHSYGQLIYYPYGCSNVNNPSADLFHSIGLEMKEKIIDDQNKSNTYGLGSYFPFYPDTDGTDIDWQWKEHGVLAYTLEVNENNFQPNYNTWRDITVKRQEGGWKALLRRMTKTGFKARVQTNNTDQVSYVLHKVDAGKKIPFDADTPNRKFSLRSNTGLLYQITAKGLYEMTFYVGNEVVKSVNFKIGDEINDLGDIIL